MSVHMINIKEPDFSLNSKTTARKLPNPSTQHFSFSPSLTTTFLFLPPSTPVHHPVLRGEEGWQHPQVLFPPGHPHLQHPQQADGAEEQGAGPWPATRGDDGRVCPGDHPEPAGGGAGTVCAGPQLCQLPGTLWQLSVPDQERILPWVWTFLLWRGGGGVRGWGWGRESRVGESRGGMAVQRGMFFDPCMSYEYHSDLWNMFVWQVSCLVLFVSCLMA